MTEVVLLPQGMCPWRRHCEEFRRSAEANDAGKTCVGGKKRETQRERERESDEHQQTGFAASTVTDDHEFSANLSHDDG